MLSRAADLALAEKLAPPLALEGRETAKPTHSDRALEEAEALGAELSTTLHYTLLPCCPALIRALLSFEAKVPLLGSDVTAPTIGIAIGTQACQTLQCDTFLKFSPSCR